MSKIYIYKEAKMLSLYLFFNSMLLTLLCFLTDILHASIIRVELIRCGKNIDDILVESKREAIRTAVEQYIGVLLESKTLVFNGKLIKDIISTYAAGRAIINKQDIVSVSLNEKSMQICINFDFQIKILKDNYSINGINRLTVLTDKRRYKDGEPINVIIDTGNFECYPYIFTFNHNQGFINMLYPIENFVFLPIKGNWSFPTDDMLKNNITLIAVHIGNKESINEIFVLCSKHKVKYIQKLFPKPVIVRADNREVLKKVLKRYKSQLSYIVDIMYSLDPRNFAIGSATFFVSD